MKKLSFLALAVLMFGCFSEEVKKAGDKIPPQITLYGLNDAFNITVSNGRTAAVPAGQNQITVARTIGATKIYLETLTPITDVIVLDFGKYIPNPVTEGDWGNKLFLLTNAQISGLTTNGSWKIETIGAVGTPFVNDVTRFAGEVLLTQLQDSYSAIEMNVISGSYQIKKSDQDWSYLASGDVPVSLNYTIQMANPDLYYTSGITLSANGGVKTDSDVVAFPAVGIDNSIDIQHAVATCDVTSVTVEYVLTNGKKLTYFNDNGTAGWTINPGQRLVVNVKPLSENISDDITLSNLNFVDIIWTNIEVNFQ